MKIITKRLLFIALLASIAGQSLESMEPAVPQPQYPTTSIPLEGTLDYGFSVSHVIKEKSSVISLAFGPNGNTILTGSDDRTARLWDITTGQQLHSFTGHTSSITSVAYSPDGKTVLTGSMDGTVRLWDVDTEQQLRTFTGSGEPILSVAYSPDGTTVLAGSSNNIAYLWNISTGVIVHELIGHTGWIYSVAFSPDGKTILTGSGDTTARLWDARTGNFLRSFVGHNASPLSGAIAAGITSVSFSPDGKTVLTGSVDTTARVWDTNTGMLLHTLQEKSHLKRERVKAVFGPDGNTVLTASYDKAAYLWDIKTERQLLKLVHHRAPLTAIAYNSNGTIATGSGDSTVVIWKRYSKPNT